jgi:hypothetical protein
MPRNLYFSQGSTSEKSLYEDITIEALKIYGHDVFYIPRTIVNTDGIFNEAELSKFGSAYQIEMYVENTDGFEGEGDLLSKFGVEVRDSMTLVLSTRRWEQLIGRFQPAAEVRPQEGDLIYFPLVKGLFEIRFVEDDNPFYQLQNLPTFKLTCETFEYANEAIDTGIAEVDRFETDYASRTMLTLGAGIGQFQVGEDVTQINTTGGITVTGEVSVTSTAPIDTLSAPLTGPQTGVFTSSGTGDATIQKSGGNDFDTSATHVKVSGLNSFFNAYTGTFPVTNITSTSIGYNVGSGPASGGPVSCTVEVGKLGYAPGANIEITSQESNKPTAKVNGTVSASTNVTLDDNVGTLVAGMSVLGEGLPTGITISTVTSQTAIVLSDIVNLEDNSNLSFIHSTNDSSFKMTSGTLGNIIGSKSSASYSITAIDAFSSMNNNDEYSDNEDFETIGNNFIDFSEENPFGKPNITS